MWIYSQRSGRFLLNDEVLATGYSGFGPGRNLPAAQQRQGIGPIPVGAYCVGQMIPESTSHGPIVIPLLPFNQTEVWGRSGFLIHGDSILQPGSASHGCIILPRPVRERIAASDDKLLVVLSGMVSL